MNLPNSKDVIESIRKKLEKQNKQNKQSDESKFKWSPKDGEKNRIRILPYPHGVDPFTELYFHFDLPNRPMCPKLSFPEENNRCAICEFAEELLKEAKEVKAKTKEKNSLAWQQYKKMSANMRAFCVILVRGKEAEGPKIFGMSQTNYTFIQNRFIDPEYGDLSDILEGRDLELDSKKQNGPDGKSFVKTMISTAANKTPLFPPTGNKKEDNLRIASLIASIPKITDVYEVTTYEDTKKILDEFLHRTADEEDEEYRNINDNNNDNQNNDLNNSSDLNDSDLDNSDDIDSLLEQLSRK